MRGVTPDLPAVSFEKEGILVLPKDLYIIFTLLMYGVIPFHKKSDTNTGPVETRYIASLQN